jgi:hypothetical protein
VFGKTRIGGFLPNPPLGDGTQEEYRSSGVQEFRRILNKRTCVEIGATSQAYSIDLLHKSWDAP